MFKDTDDLPARIVALGRELCAAEHRAATALLAWLRTGKEHDHQWLRSAVETRQQVDVQIRRNLTMLRSSSPEGDRAAERLARSIRWDARDAYLDGMGLKPGAAGRRLAVAS